AVFKFADRAKGVALVGGLIRVQSQLRQLAGESNVVLLYSIACAKPKRFCFEALKNLLQLFLRRLRNHHTTWAGIAEGNLLCSAEIADTIEVTEKIKDEGFVAREQRENRSPKIRGLLAPYRLAAFGLQDFHTNGFDLSSEIKRLHIERKGWKIES